MATSLAMSEIPVRATIKELGLSAVADATGLPVSTIFRWKEQDRIPGGGAAHQIRRDLFEKAVKELRRAPKKGRAA
jgi:hypothetical protein